MHRTPVLSSNIASIGYDSGTAVLEVEFKSGSVYQYFQIPPGIYQSLMATDAAGQSVGQYFNHHVKRAGYRYVEL